MEVKLSKAEAELLSEIVWDIEEFMQFRNGEKQIFDQLKRKFSCKAIKEADKDE